jgi:DNA invertase Pin-like site-specific DNA recombinase
MKAVSYYRVSTKGQGEDYAYGLPKQRAEIDAYLSAHPECEIIDEYEDVGYSGSTADRPGLAAMLLADGFEAIIVAAYDRFARNNMLDGYLRYKLNERGIRVLSATQANGLDPTSVMLQGILASVAGYERHLITARMMGGRRVKAAQGGYAHGQAPYGTQAVRKTGILHHNPAEYAILQGIIAMRTAGNSFRAIASALNDNHVPSRTGKAWSAMTIRGAIMSADRAKTIATLHQSHTQEPK